jgi:hypothetical protein
LRLAITRRKLDKETGRLLEIRLVDKLAAGSLMPDPAIQNNNINLGLAERRWRARTPLHA